MVEVTPPARTLRRGVGGRHLNEVSYLSEESKTAANKVARREKIKRMGVGFNQTVKASNNSIGTLANNSRRYGDGTQQFSTATMYEDHEQMYGPLGEVHMPGEGNNTEIFNKGLWTTDNNKRAAAKERYAEQKVGIKYVNNRALRYSTQPYKPTATNTKPLSPGGNAYVRPMIKKKNGSIYPYQRTRKTSKTSKTSKTRKTRNLSRRN